MVELKGSLGIIGLPAILELIGDLRHSGRLELFKGSARGVLDFEDGRAVAAEVDGETGYKALAKLSVELSDAEFTFMEGQPTHQRTLDLSSKDVLAFVARAANGEDITQVAPPAPVEPNGSTSLGACPMLGFADDQSRHYSRPTALHRCFAAGQPSLVTGEEQRELCLSGRYPTCPRYRNSASSSTPTSATWADLNTVAAVPSSPPPPSPDPAASPASPAAFVPAPPRGPDASPNVTGESRAARPELDAPAAGGVDLRRVHLGEGTADVPNPDWSEDPVGRSLPPATSPPAQTPARPPRRALLLVGSGVLLGLIALAAVVFAMRRVYNAPSDQNAGVAGAQASAQPLPTPTRATAAVTAPRTTETPGASARAPQSSPAPNGAAGPASVASVAASPASAASGSPVPSTSSPAPGQPLIDVRFAAGPADRWIENPPFATWSTGAYRLQTARAAQFVAVAAPVPSSLSNVLVAGTFRKTGGPPGGGYGLVLRDLSPAPRDGVNQKLNAYVFEAGDLGQFGIWRRDGDHWVDLIPWTQSSAVRLGGSPNDLLVRATGVTFTFAINGQEVATVQDDTLPTGGVGVFVGGDNNEVALDHFSAENSY